MARDEEKANSMFHRFRDAQRRELGLPSLDGGRRPRNVDSCDTVPLCTKWRSQVISEIGNSISKIQDTGLTDDAVRDLNDKINRLIREKTRWEYRIRDLGGPDYIQRSKQIVKSLKNSSDEESLINNGIEVPGSKGYKYFGRARELNDVKELLATGRVKNTISDFTSEEKEPDSKKVKRKQELISKVDLEYFGFIQGGTENHKTPSGISELFFGDFPNNLRNLDCFKSTDNFLENNIFKISESEQKLQDGSIEEFRYLLNPPVPTQQMIAEYLRSTSNHSQDIKPIRSKSNKSSKKKKSKKSNNKKN